jgi:hypothetical protein
MASNSAGNLVGLADKYSEMEEQRQITGGTHRLFRLGCEIQDALG